MIIMTITLADDGKLHVEGIPTNKLQAYGMLACAKESITEMYRQQAERLVQPATLIPPSGLIRS
jgi:hypothetical protein